MLEEEKQDYRCLNFSFLLSYTVNSLLSAELRGKETVDDPRNSKNGQGLTHDTLEQICLKNYIRPTSHRLA